MAETNDQLSEREIEILRLAAAGKSNKEIASELVISTNTVKVHLRNIFKKTGVNSRTEAAMHAAREGLLAGETLVEGDGVNPTSPEGLNWNRSVFRWFVPLAIVLVLSVTLVSILAIRASRSARDAETEIPPVEWRERAPLPEARASMAMVAYLNRLYAVGGETAKGVSAGVSIYDPQTNTWGKGVDKQHPVTDIQAAAVGGRIFIPGGRTGESDVFDILEIYDPNTDSWTLGKRMPLSLSAYALAEYEGKIYLFGGRTGGEYTNRVFLYDPSQDEWTELPAMKVPRGFGQAVVSGEQIHVIGGTDGSAALAVHEVFSPDRYEAGQGPWSEVEPLPDGRYSFSAENIAENIRIFGGVGGSEKSLSALDYSPQNDSYLEIALTQELSDWSHMGSDLLDVDFYGVGGFNKDRISAENYTYQALFLVSIPVIR
jgi:DNA-binding CsgD family transcriptional regulator